MLGDVSAEQGRALREYGFNLGIAFQLVDDLLYFTGDADARQACGWRPPGREGHAADHPAAGGRTRGASRHRADRRRADGLARTVGRHLAHAEADRGARPRGGPRRRTRPRRPPPARDSSRQPRARGRSKPSPISSSTGDRWPPPIESARCARRSAGSERLYYERDAPEISDAEFDALMLELALEAAHPDLRTPTRRPNASVDSPSRAFLPLRTCRRCSVSTTPIPTKSSGPSMNVCAAAWASNRTRPSPMSPS